MSRLALFLAVAALGSASFAQSKVIRFERTALGLGVKFNYKGKNINAFAGQLEFIDLSDSSKFTSYCVDLDHFISGGQSYGVDVVRTIDDPTFALAGSVYSNSYAGVASNVSASALQVAIWAARYGTNLSTNTGSDLKFDAGWYSNNQSVINQAITMTDQGKNNVLDATLLRNQGGDSAGQSQLTPVPEPVTLVALGAGLAAIARRRKK